MTDRPTDHLDVVGCRIADQWVGTLDTKIGLNCIDDGKYAHQTEQALEAAAVLLRNNCQPGI